MGKEKGMENVSMAEPAIYYPALEGIGSINVPKLHFLSPENQEDFDDFSPIIVLGGTLNFIGKGEGRIHEAARIEREIFNSLKRGCLVCLTGNIDDLMSRVIGRIGVDYEEDLEALDLEVELTVKRSEFASFYERFGATTGRFFTGDFDDVICVDKNKDVVGFAKKVEKGVLVLLPCNMLYEKFSDYRFLNRFLNSVFGALKRYGPRIQYKPPIWIETFRFPEESIIVSQKEEIQNELKKRLSYLERYLRLKEILWFRDDELVSSLMDFFNAIGIKTKRDEIYEEDFWIMEKNNETIIVEVKALDRNLKRQHISQLDEHRGARDKPDDFPALLVVNSFNRARTLKEKDQDISSNEIKKAFQLNALILRTLDLCNAYSLMEEKKLDTKELIDIIKSEKGWLKISASGLEAKRK